MPRKKESGATRTGTGKAASARTRAQSKARSESVVAKTKTALENQPVPEKVTMATPKSAVQKSLAAFPDRLNWKMTHSKMPTTSTPKVDLTSRKITQADVETAFGFDDSCNNEVMANYSTLISPIPTTSKSGRVPVWKVNPLTQRNVESEKPEPEPVAEKIEIAKRSTRSKTRKTTKLTAKSKNENSDSVSQPLPLPNTSIPDKVQLSPNVANANTILLSPAARDVESSLSEKSDLNEVQESVTVIQKPLSKPTIVSTKNSKKRKAPPATEEGKRRSKRIKSNIPAPISKSIIYDADSEAVSTTNKTTKSKTKPLKSKKVESRPIVSATTSKKLKPTTSSQTRKKKTQLLIVEDTVEEPSPFSALCEKYNDDEIGGDEVDKEFRVDRKKIVRTYTPSRKRVRISEDRETEYDFPSDTNTEFHLAEGKQRRIRHRDCNVGVGSKGKARKQREDEFEEEAEKWLAERNKEFEDVLKAPLVIENSFSD